jgi:uncharacterized RDD family membrane protein YckC
MSADSLQRAFVTSEGVDLRLNLGRVGERAAAFIIDCMIMLAALITLTIAAMFAFVGSGAAEMVIIVWLLGFFVLRNGYFIAFELGMRAATPGKRIMKLRVVARDGGRLTGEAVVARNAMRELEFFLPLTFFGYQGAESGFDVATWLFGFGTAAAFLVFPLFNRDNLRVGDLIAGTWVVRQPRRELGHNLVLHGRSDSSLVFTDAQLDAYGEFELQKLEEVLRREDAASVVVVAQAIRGRIGWTQGGDELEFLRAYYKALCERLERNMLFGKRRADKHQKV